VRNLQQVVIIPAYGCANFLISN